MAYARKLALAKARAVARSLPQGLVLGADTIVVHKGKILGKPADLAEGFKMLAMLQGTTHKVITAIALVDAATSKGKVAHAVSTVTMRPIPPAEIFRCAQKNLDKAGCYAAQEKKDPVVKKVVGSYSNVVGLPLELVKELLKPGRIR